MPKEIDIRITATPLSGGAPMVSTVRGDFPDRAPERGRVACKHVWLQYPDAVYVGYLHGEARFTHPEYDIVAAMVWDTQTTRVSKPRVAEATERMF